MTLRRLVDALLNPTPPPRPAPRYPGLIPAHYFTPTPEETPVMYEITKDFHFSASHVLDGLPADHPCARLHGHNFIVRLHLAAEEVDDVGFVVDYRDLYAFSDWLDESFDHRHLNDRVHFNPTAENMCAWLYGQARDACSLPVVAVSWM